MNVKAAFLATLSAVLLCRAVASEAPPPVPYLNADGSKPAGVQNQFVFIDPRSGDAVAIYKASPAADGGPPVRVVIPLQRHVAPTVRSVMTFNNEGSRVRYEYEFHNGSGARQPAGSWFFDGLFDSEQIRVEDSIHWKHWFPAAPPGFTNAANLRKSLMMARALQIHALNARGSIRPSEGVPPGHSRKGLTLSSELRPGLIPVYAQGGGVVVAFPDEPPMEVSAQVELVRRFPYNFRHTVAFGPKYPATMSKRARAEALLADLASLVTANEIDPSGAFAKAIQAALQTALNESGPTAIDWSAPIHLAKTGIESEFLTASQLTLKP